MVTDGSIESTVLKAKYGSDIRKSQLHHSNDLTYNDLLLMMQRIFKIKPSTSVILKYRDSDGDLVTLTDDTDLLLAIRTEPGLSIEVFTDADDIAGQLSQLDGLLNNINESAKTLKRTLQNVLQTKSDVPERSASPLVSPREKVTHQESVATIQPSVHEQVDNGHVSNLAGFPPTNHIKRETLEEELALHQHEPYKPIQPPQQFLNQPLENVPIDNNGHHHQQHSPACETQRTEEISLHDHSHDYQNQQFQHQPPHPQFQQVQQQQPQHLQNSFSPPPANDAFRGTPQFQQPQQGFQQPPSSQVGGFPPMGPPSGTITPQFQQPPQMQPQVYKPPTSIGAPPPPQQFGMPPGGPQQPQVLPPGAFPPGAPRPPSQFGPPGAGAPGMPPFGQPGQQAPPQQFGGMPPPGAPPMGGQFQPTGPTPPPSAFGAPPPMGGPGGIAGNPFARAPAPQGSYVRPNFSTQY